LYYYAFSIQAFQQFSNFSLQEVAEILREKLRLFDGIMQVIPRNEAKLSGADVSTERVDGLWF
jgi:hypothetical protein